MNAPKLIILSFSTAVYNATLVCCVQLETFEIFLYNYLRGVPANYPDSVA